MSRFIAGVLALVLVGISAPVFASDTTKEAKGTVKTVAADSLTVTDADGKDWTFVVDTKTKLTAAGGSHKSDATKSMGKSLSITDLVKAGSKVAVKYTEADGKMRAANVRVL